MCNQWNRKKYQICTCDEGFPYNHSNNNEKCDCNYKFDNVRRKWSNYAKCQQCNPPSRYNNTKNVCNYCNNALDNLKGIFGYAWLNENPDDMGKFPLKCQFETIASIGSLKSKFKDVFGKVVESIQSEKQTQCCVKKQRHAKRGCNTKSNFCQCCLKDNFNKRQNCCVHFCTCSIDGDDCVPKGNCGAMSKKLTHQNMEVCCCQPAVEKPMECACHQENCCECKCECDCMFSECESIRKFLAVLLLLIMIAIGYYVDKTLSPCVRRYRLY